MGHGELPDYIKNANSIVPLEGNGQHQLYKENLCAFRALACHYNAGKLPCDQSVDSLYRRWCEYTGSFVSRRRFTSVKLEDLPDFEKCFKVNLFVYELLPTQSVLPHYRSRCHFKEDVHFNMYNNHLSYVKNFKMYAKTYKCPTCERIFNKHGNWKAHLRVCNYVTKHKYVGGFMQKQKTIFEDLSSFGIEVDERDRY